MFRVVTSSGIDGGLKIDQPSYLLLCDNRTCGSIVLEPLDRSVSQAQSDQAFMVKMGLTGWNISIQVQICPACAKRMRDQEAARKAAADNRPRVMVANPLQQKMAEREAGPVERRSAVMPPLELDPIDRSVVSDLPQHWRPPIELSLSDWSEANVNLSPEYSSRSGPIHLYGWQREPFDAFTDPYTREVVLMVGVQMLKTLFIQCAMAYVVKEAPGPVLLVMPTENDGKEFSKERMTPMIRDNPCLHGRLSDSVHDGANTILGKSFPGGRLSIVSAITPGNLARRSIRYLFCDEVDKYPVSAGREGDPMNLAEQRLVTFGTRAKLIRTCSPTLAGQSRIGKAYNLSDGRQPWVNCPACQHSQLLAWSQVKFDTSLDRDKIPLSAYYQCNNPACNARWTDVQRKAAANAAVWKAQRPFAGVAGFWISHLYSPWKNLSDIVKHFLDVKDDRQQFQVFVNTVLAEQWEEKGETPDAEILYARREDYPYGSEAIVPQRGLFLTAGVDVQDNPPRLECEVKAWGRYRENWSVGYFVIQCYADNGEPLPVTSPELWDKLDSEVLHRNFQHESGATMQIYAMAIDTGSRPKPVYDFALKHPQIHAGPQGTRVFALRTVVPVKGDADPLKIISKVSKEDAARKRQNILIVSVGTYCAKQQIYDALKHIKPNYIRGEIDADRPKPGYWHFPMYERSYFDGLCSEYRVIDEKGKISYQKKVGIRNEPIDCAVYALAAAVVCGIDRMPEDYWRKLEAAVEPMSVEDLTGQTPAGTDVGPTGGPTSAKASGSVPQTPRPPAPQPQSQPGSEPPRRKIRFAL